jgi:hypothetical protein
MATGAELGIDFTAIKSATIGHLAFGCFSSGGNGGGLCSGAGLSGIHGTCRRNAGEGRGLLRRRYFGRAFSIEINAGNNQQDGDQHQGGDDLGKIFHEHKIVVTHKTPVWAVARIWGTPYYIGACVLNKALIASIFSGK